jgi:hypothetical protein
MMHGPINIKSDWKIQRLARSAVGIHLNPVTDTPVSNKKFVNCQTVLRCHIKDELREGLTYSASIDRTFLILSEESAFLPNLSVQIPPGYKSWKSLAFPKGSPFHPTKGMWTRHQARIPQEYPTSTITNNIHELCNNLKGRVYQEINTRTLEKTRG